MQALLTDCQLLPLSVTWLSISCCSSSRPANLQMQLLLTDSCLLLLLLPGSQIMESLGGDQLWFDRSTRPCCTAGCSLSSNSFPRTICDTELTPHATLQHRSRPSDTQCHQMAY